MQETDYTENLFRSIDTIIAERVKHLSYDTTEIVEIIDDKNAANGIYKISPNGQFEEIIYSDNPTYKIGDKVYLLRIANSERRFIIGLYLRSDGGRINRIFDQLNNLKDQTNILSEKCDEILEKLEEKEEG